MQYFQKALDLIKKHKIISAVIVVAIVGLGYYRYKHTNKAQAVRYVTAAASKQTITVVASATGQVSAENQIDLKPGSAGKLTQVNVKTGDTVKNGQVLAVVDQSSNNVALAQARASVLSAQANYDKLIAGLTGSDLTTAQRAVSDAQKALDKANRDYSTAVADQLQDVQNANTDLLNSGLLAIPSDLITTTTTTLSGSYTGTTEGTYTIKLYDTINAGTYYSTSGLGNQSGALTRGVALPLGNGLYITFSTSGTLNISTTWTIDVPNKTSSSYTNNLQAYNSALQNQIKAIQTAQDNIDSAQDNLTQAQQDFNDKTAAPDNVDVAQARASVLSAQAQLQSASNNYNNNVLKAPFDGMIAVVNNKTNDQVTASTVVMTVITKQQLAAVSLNEIDASKVKAGQKTNLTFDALDGLNLTGSVAEIDSLGTVTQGVVSYAVKIAFDTQDARIKPGMSVDVAIITDVAPDVLAVPSSAVKSDANGSYVQILKSGTPSAVAIEVGLSNDSYTQIKSGLTSGEEVISQTITPSTTTSSKAGSTVQIPGITGGNANFTGRGAGTTGAGR